MNILGYVKTHRQTFAQEEINAVDYLILSWVSYFDFACVCESFPITIEELALNPLYNKTLRPYFECFEPRKTVALVKAMGASGRFKDIKIIANKVIYNANGTMLYASIALKIGNSIVISYKGTGFSYQGWKEDFMLSYQSEIESHRSSREFFEEIASKEEGEIVLIGHSKGGNLAVNTLFTVDDPNRIKEVYSFDGPGVGRLPVGADETQKKKVHKYIPQSSVVGMLFESEFDSRIVRSNALFVFQHNLFSWEIRKGDFLYLKKRTVYTDNLVESLEAWIDSLPGEDKEKFTFLVFGALEGLKARDFSEFGKTWLFQVAPLLRSYGKLSEEDKGVVKRVIKSLSSYIRRPKKKVKKAISE
ncbi:MAG: DUF2974 domain-containing protein [Bacilli bacterium]|nr:DUF2974 domain-containing protein [Bacilli bacterium]